MIGRGSIGRVVRHLARGLRRSPAPADLPVATPWQSYSDLARVQGFDRLYLLLSFDCDRHEDADVAEMVDGWLAERGIPRTYAGRVDAAMAAIRTLAAELDADILP